MTPTRAVHRVWAVVPAAGRGERFAGEDQQSPRKQYAPLRGSTVMDWSLKALLAEERITSIVVVLSRDDDSWPQALATIRAREGERAAMRLQIAAGGATRRDSVLSGLEALQAQVDPADWVLVHDAARPCLSSEDLSRLLGALESGAAGAILATPIADTVKRERSGVCTETVERSGLWRAMTPQAFRYADLRRALSSAAKAGLPVTDEAQAMEAIGVFAALVPGSGFNIKITTREDLKAASRVLGVDGETNMRIGQGFDVHAFTSGDHVTLGGVRIAHTHGILAHSDGDVVIHALCDAILGALGQGDIGRLFPDSDPAYRGMDSRRFLREIAARVRQAGFALANADITVIAEAPKIAPHGAAMIGCLSADLGVEGSRINVKATTTERLGYLGRKEGIAALAVVLLLASRNP